MTTELIPIQIIENKIFVIRGHKIILDSDLAMLYEVETKILNQAVKRNPDKFPPDFMFELTQQEWNFLRSQFVTSNEGRGGRRYLPKVFTEHGVLMLSNLLNSKKAVAVSIQIVRAFVKLREMALTHAEFSKQLKEIELTFINYAKQNNADVEEIFQQLEYLTERTNPNQIRV